MWYWIMFGLAYKYWLLIWHGEENDEPKIKNSEVLSFNV